MRGACDGPARVVVLPRGSLILPRQQPLESSSIFRARTLFDPIFEGQFWRSSGTQNGSCRHIVGKLSTSSFQRYKVCEIGVRTRGVMAPGSRGVGAVFACTFPVKIPVKRGMLSANREFHDVAGVVIFPTHPGSRINLLRAGKTLRAKAALPMSDFDVLGTVGKLALPTFCKVPDSRESELGLREIWFPRTEATGGVFDQLVASQEDSVRKRGNVGGKVPEFSAQPYFVGLFSRAWPCTEASLGSQDMILRTEAVGMFLMPRGHLLTEIPA
uniref:Uncharacterized protein n=1 Tax=Fagus sylvatica TaxID=28930 RepID=A0A2N9GR42_FAGSY